MASKVTPGEVSSAVCERAPQSSTSALSPDPRLRVRVGEGGPTAVEYDLQRHYDAFHAQAEFAAAAGKPDGSVELSVWLDDERALELTLHRADARQPLDVVLTGHSRMSIRIGDAGDGISGDDIVLSEFRIE
jgi:NPCBM/NEW2 domain